MPSNLLGLVFTENWCEALSQWVWRTDELCCQNWRCFALFVVGLLTTGRCGLKILVFCTWDFSRGEITEKASAKLSSGWSHAEHALTVYVLLLCVGTWSLSRVDTWEGKCHHAMCIVKSAIIASTLQLYCLLAPKAASFLVGRLYITELRSQQLLLMLIKWCVTVCGWVDSSHWIQLNTGHNDAHRHRSWCFALVGHDVSSKLEALLCQEAPVWGRLVCCLGSFKCGRIAFFCFNANCVPDRNSGRAQTIHLASGWGTIIERLHSINWLNPWTGHCSPWQLFTKRYTGWT